MLVQYVWNSFNLCKLHEMRFFPFLKICVMRDPLNHYRIKFIYFDFFIKLDSTTKKKYTPTPLCQIQSIVSKPTPSTNVKFLGVLWSKTVHTHLELWAKTKQKCPPKHILKFSLRLFEVVNVTNGHQWANTKNFSKFALFPLQGDSTISNPSTPFKKGISSLFKIVNSIFIGLLSD